jgi:Acetyltransferases
MLRIEAMNAPDNETISILLGVWEHSVRATHSFLTDEDIAAIRPDVSAGFGMVRLLVAREREHIMGFAGVYEDRLEMLFVDAEARGQGVGRLLLEHATAGGVNRLDVNEQNPQALRFYERMGFVVTGRSETDGQGRAFPLLHMQLAP